MSRKEQISERVWTIPNIVSYLRIVFLVPLSMGLIVSNFPGWALVTLFLVGISDGLDGFLARKLRQTSKLGKEVDPVSDRVSIILISFSLVFVGLLPTYLFSIIFGFDLLMAIVIVTVFKGNPNVTASWVGKVRTALLLVGLPLLLLAATLQSEMLRQIALAVLVLGVIGQVIAFFGYIRVMFANRFAG